MIVISDVHIGRPDSQIAELEKFLIEENPDLLILNGDIFDRYAIPKNWKTFKKHLRIVARIWKRLDGEVIYILGNHDRLAFLLFPFVKIRRRVTIGEYIIEHGHLIRGEGDYHERVNAYAKKKGKKLIVGHSHDPGVFGDVYDCGDWVGHKSWIEI